MLRWFERGFLIIGVALGIWCALVLVEARRVAHMPVPEPTAATASTDKAPLPGTPDAPAKPVQPTPPVQPVPPATGAWVAKLDAPSVHLSATVLEGSDDGTLARGAGHIEYTPLPGQSGNIGIAGHRDTTFRAVRHLRPGDALELTTADRVYRYVISKTFVVEPEDVYVLDPGDQPMMTLVTCYPFEFIGHAPHRYIIQAVLVGEAPRHGILIATTQ
jgi:sortase A